MSVNVTIIWTPERCESVLREALAVVERVEPPEDLKVLAFQLTVQMMTTIAQATAPAAVAMPLPDFLDHRRH